AEDGIRAATVTGVQTCALPISCAVGHEEWRVAHLRRRSWEYPILAPRSDRPHELQQTADRVALQDRHSRRAARLQPADHASHAEIGRASCRERNTISRRAATTV